PENWKPLSAPARRKKKSNLLRGAYLFSASSGNDLIERILLKFTNPSQRDVRRWVLRDQLFIEGIMTLAREYRGDASTPILLYRRQKAYLVVHHDVMFRWISRFDVRQLRFLVHV